MAFFELKNEYEEHIELVQKRAGNGEQGGNLVEKVVEGAHQHRADLEDQVQQNLQEQQHQRPPQKRAEVDP